MIVGRRAYRSASLRIAIPTGLPVEMLDGAREIVSLRAETKRQGHASTLLRSTCQEADRLGIVLIVQPGAFDDGMTTEQLIGWYAVHGFVALPKDDGAPVVMARQALRVTIANRPTIGVHLRP